MANARKHQPRQEAWRVDVDEDFAATGGGLRVSPSSGKVRPHSQRSCLTLPVTEATLQLPLIEKVFLARLA